MKKTYLVDFNFCTRVIVDVDPDSPNQEQTIVEQCKVPILEKVLNDLSENLAEIYEDEECPFDENLDTATIDNSPH